MQRTDFSLENCTIARTLGLVGEWWSLLIIREAFGGVTRRDGFQRRLGISRNASTKRLRRLVEGGRRLSRAQIGLAFAPGRPDPA